MIDIHKLESYTIEVIESFITNEIEESIHIEFKSNGALSKSEHHKKEIGRDISAFANSDGGIIIYGITEESHKASSLSYINGNEFTKEWLEQVISSSIQRNIPDLKIFPIRENGNIDQTIYVVQIPASEEAPHMAIKDNKFYRRFNFQSVVMEEYEIRNLYNRKSKSILKLSGFTISEKINSGGTSELIFNAGVYNAGKVLEENYKINVYLINFPPKTQVLCESAIFSKNHSYTRLDERFKVSATSIAPIYPDEAIDIVEFSVRFQKQHNQFATENSIVEFVLLYPNGTDKLRSKLENIFKF